MRGVISIRARCSHFHSTFTPLHFSCHSPPSGVNFGNDATNKMRIWLFTLDGWRELISSLDVKSQREKKASHERNRKSWKWTSTGLVVVIWTYFTCFYVRFVRYMGLILAIYQVSSFLEWKQPVVLMKWFLSIPCQWTVGIAETKSVYSLTNAFLSISLYYQQ